MQTPWGRNTFSVLKHSKVASERDVYGDKVKDHKKSEQEGKAIEGSEQKADITNLKTIALAVV